MSSTRTSRVSSSIMRYSVNMVEYLSLLGQIDHVTAGPISFYYRVLVCRASRPFVDRKFLRTLRAFGAYREPFHGYAYRNSGAYACVWVCLLIRSSTICSSCMLLSRTMCATGSLFLARSSYSIFKRNSI